MMTGFYLGMDSYLRHTFLPPANEVHRCLSVHRGVCPIACWDTPRPPADTPPPGQTPLSWADTAPLGRHPPQADTLLWADIPPTQCMLGYGQQAGGMHPTGMHSCTWCVRKYFVVHPTI